MAIKIECNKGEFSEYRNSEYLPAFFFIPKEILAKCGNELNSISRNAQQLMRDPEAIAMIESDLFLLLIIDAYAFMVWPFMGLGAKREIYSGYEPSWILAHNPGYWIKTLTDLGILPMAEDWIRQVDYDESFVYVSLVEVEATLQKVVPIAMERYNMHATIEVAKEFRCFEDFDYRSSRQKTDFYRKWYHTRTEHPQISLESFQEDYAASHDGREWDVPDESTNVELYTTAKVQVDQFMATLYEKDKQILQLRMEGRTLEEIAEKLSYQNHSGVLKRICKIGQFYEKFADVDYGFTDKKII